jgi:hypothetical protein
MKNKIYTVNQFVNKRIQEDMIQKELFDQNIRNDQNLDGEKWIYLLN